MHFFILKMRTEARLGLPIEKYAPFKELSVADTAEFTLRSLHTELGFYVNSAGAEYITPEIVEKAAIAFIELYRRAERFSSSDKHKIQPLLTFFHKIAIHEDTSTSKASQS